jgi:hypothetical protein
MSNTKGLTMNNKSLLKELENYYQSQFIYALDFNCPNFEDCSRGIENFTEAKSAYVSSGYEQHILPRLIVLSSDPGSGWPDPNHRTPEYVRYHEEEIYRLDEGRTNQQWYQTHSMVHQLLQPFKLNMNIRDAKHFFAHLNSAKCSVNNSKRSQAKDRLFTNCFRFLRGEIQILEPDILISQGDKAKQSVATLFEVIPFPENSYFQEVVIPDEVKLIRAGANKILWIQMYHPNQRQSFYQKKNLPKFTQYQSLIQKFTFQKSHAME